MCDTSRRECNALAISSSTSKPCRLLVTHDDYSILSKLPSTSVSVITNMRHPVDRIFSAYEFSVEVASRFLAQNHRKTDLGMRITKLKGSSTLNIWPWSLLVPWMRDDLFTREKTRKRKGSKAYTEGLSHYNASVYVMPLHAFIRQPMVIDILHNGATFQVAGLTNNSYDKGAAKVRNCVIDFPELGHHVLDIAKRRMDRMLFVGLTDKHEDTSKLFARIIGGQMLPVEDSMISTQPVFSSEVSTIKYSPASLHLQQAASTGTGSHNGSANEILTVDGLIKKYENCAERLRSKQVQRRIRSLENALPVNFSVEARREVEKETLEAIEQMNSLDVELYAYAQLLFSKYSRHLMQKSLIYSQL